MDKYEQLAEILVRDAVKRAVDHYGIEGAEDAIKRAYSHPNMHKCRDVLLKTLHSLNWKLDDPKLFEED